MLKSRRESALGTALRTARKGAKLTQAVLAEQVGINVSTVAEAERGNGRADTYFRLAGQLGMEVTGRCLPAGNSFGDRLALLRRRQGISQCALAENAEVSVPTVIAVERGEAGFLAPVERIAAALGAGLCLVPIGEAQNFYVAAGNSSAHQAWTTPPEILEKLYDVVGGRFDLDPCSPTTDRRTAPVRARVRYTAEDDGLSLPWRGSVFVNPPYGRELAGWMAKCRQEAKSGQAAPVIALVPARPDTGWWHNEVVGHAAVMMLKGRLKFGGAGGQSAPFPSAIIMWGGTDGHRQRLRETFPDGWLVPAKPIVVDTVRLALGGEVFGALERRAAGAGMSADAMIADILMRALEDNDDVRWAEAAE